MRCLRIAVVGALLFAPQVKVNAAEEVSVVLAAGPVWNRHAIDDTSQGADGVKLGDVNGDGLTDIVTGWEEGGEVRLYLHPGPSSVRAAWPRVTVGKVKSVEDAILADLDGDGRLDVISCAEGKTRTMFWHRFVGQEGSVLDAQRWQTVALPATAGQQSWMQAAAMDIDGTHGVDLVVGSKGERAAVGWLQAPESPGRLADWTYNCLREAAWIMSLEPQDMDGDGDLDVVFSDRYQARSGVFWLENPGPQANRGHAAWTEHPIGAAGRQAMFADLGDVNGDGLLDVAVAVKPADVVLCLQQAAVPWREQVLHLDRTNLGSAKAVKLADLNSDGLVDICFTCEEASQQRAGVVWLEQQQEGLWKQHPLGGPAGVKFDLMQVLDLDADGDLDAITCEERDQLGVVWYENPARGGP